MSKIDDEFRKLAEEAIERVHEWMKAVAVTTMKPKCPHYKPLRQMLINGGWKKYAWKNRYEGVRLK